MEDQFFAQLGSNWFSILNVIVMQFCIFCLFFFFMLCIPLNELLKPQTCIRSSFKTLTNSVHSSHQVRIFLTIWTIFPFFFFIHYAKQVRIDSVLLTDRYDKISFFINIYTHSVQFVKKLPKTLKSAKNIRIFSFYTI